MEERLSGTRLFEEVVRRSGFWTTTGPFGHIVISSRIRLARNMRDVPFPNRMESDDARPVFDAIERFAKGSTYGGRIALLRMNEIDSNEKRFLRERNIITYEMEVSDHGLLIINNSDDFSILVNEEDHVRIQVIRPGLQFMEAYRVGDAVDDELNAFFPYAFSDELGYLSACVSNIGTGIRVSAMLHLPVLTMKNRINGLVPEGKSNSVELKGTLGRSSKTLGSIYQLSNRVSLGLSEVDVIESVDDVLGSILDLEDTMRDEMYTESRHELDDRIWRSFGCMLHARRMSYIEAMDHLSDIRLGIILAVIKNLDTKTVNDLMVGIQWAHLQRHFGCYFKSTSECDEYRSEYIRAILGSIEVK